MSLEITVDTKGIERLIQQEPQRVDAWLRGVAIMIANDVKISFNTGPAGRAYKRGRKFHVASSPGYAPNVDTGALRASVRSRPAGRLAYQISVGTSYAAYLEYGTAKMAARPFMGPVFASWAKKIEKDAREN
jgi:HK97 gp10 family phage protein